MEQGTSQTYKVGENVSDSSFPLCPIKQKLSGKDCTGWI